VIRRERSSIMALSMREKHHVGREVALRYLHARKKEKGIKLQEFLWADSPNSTKKHVERTVMLWES
jgi:hypothetical protein